MGGSNSTLLEGQVKEVSSANSIVELEAASFDIESDIVHTLEEMVVTLLLTAETAADAAEPLDNTSEANSECVPGVDEPAYIPLPIATASTTRSGRATRICSRYFAQDLVSY
jgi:hypothetical protein